MCRAINGMKQKSKNVVPVSTTCRSAKRKIVKKTKSVRFSDAPNQVTYRHVLQEELKESWYQPMEYKKIHFDKMKTIVAAHQAKATMSCLDAKEHCIRGIESQISPTALHMRKISITSAIRMVLEQQHMQKQFMGYSDPDDLALVSQAMSKSARTMARSMGTIDSQIYQANH